MDLIEKGGSEPSTVELFLVRISVSQSRETKRKVQETLQFLEITCCRGSLGEMVRGELEKIDQEVWFVEEEIALDRAELCEKVSFF